MVISADYSQYPEHVAKAVAELRGADVAGPYAIALGSRCYTGVTETTEHGGYPVFEHLRQILGGPVVWAPAVDGAVVLSQRCGDFALTVGPGLLHRLPSSDSTSVHLYVEESLLPGQHTRGRRAPRLRLGLRAYSPARSPANSARVASVRSTPGSPSG